MTWVQSSEAISQGLGVRVTGARVEPEVYRSGSFPCEVAAVDFPDPTVRTTVDIPAETSTLSPPGEPGSSPGADRMPEDEQRSIPFERWLTLAGNVIAPATAVSALLFYFGYVASRSQYEHFGLDVDTIGLGTQGFVIRSPQPLLVPLLVLSVLGAGAVLSYALLRRRLTAAFAQPTSIRELSSGAEPESESAIRG